jgi:hypothetical protein
MKVFNLMYFLNYFGRRESHFAPSYLIAENVISSCMPVRFFLPAGNGTIRELGMKDGTIKDNQITVSSPFPGRVYARLNDGKVIFIYHLAA